MSELLRILDSRTTVRVVATALVVLLILDRADLAIIRHDGLWVLPWLAATLVVLLSAIWRRV